MTLLWDGLCLITTTKTRGNFQITERQSQGCNLQWYKDEPYVGQKAVQETPQKETCTLGRHTTKHYNVYGACCEDKTLLKPHMILSSNVGPRGSRIRLHAVRSFTIAVIEHVNL